MPVGLVVPPSTHAPSEAFVIQRFVVAVVHRSLDSLRFDLNCKPVLVWTFVCACVWIPLTLDFLSSVHVKEKASRHNDDDE